MTLQKHRHILITLALLALSAFAVWQRGLRFFVTGRCQDNIMLPWADLLIYQLIIGCLALLLVPLFRSRPLARLERMPSKVFLGSVFMVALALTNLISSLVFEHFPHDVDNVARLYQAKTFAEFRLSVEAPSHPEFFEVYGTLTQDGRLFSKYNPGASLVYATWWKLTGRPWGINPLLSSLTLLAFFVLFRRWYDERTARLTILLMLGSPFFLFMSSSYHSHVPLLFFLAMFFLCLSSMSASPKWFHPLLAGLSLGTAVMTRPYTAVLVGLPGVVWFLSMHPARRLLRRLLAFAAAFAIPLSLLLLYNHALTGDPLLFPFHLAGPDERIGFGHKGHTPWLGVVNTLGMLRMLDLNLLGWPFSLLFGASFLLLGRKNRWDGFAVAASTGLILGYFFYFWTDYSFGPRFYYAATPFLLLLTARGIRALPDTTRFWNREQIVPFLSAFVALSFGFSLLIYLPILAKMYANDYNGLVHARVADVARAHSLSNALVFVEGNADQNVYAGAFLENTLDFSGPVIYAKDLGERNRELIAAYPERAAFRFRFDAATRQGILSPY